MFQLGPWMVEPSTNEILEEGGHPVKLTPLAMKLLTRLCENGNNVTSTDELLALWGDDKGSLNSLYKIVSELRAALNDNFRQPQFLVTVPKRGYRLLLETTISADESDQPPVSTGPANPAPPASIALAPLTTNHPANFVGRARELQILNQLMEQTGTKGQLLHVTGDAGIGKSFLVGRAIQLANQHTLHPVFVSCHMATGKPLLWAWIRVLQQLGSAAKLTETVTAFLNGAPELTNLVNYRLGDNSRSNSLAPHLKIWESVARLLNLCAEIQPIVLIFDDVQELDTASFQMMEFIASDLTRSRILMILTERTGPLAPPEGHLPMEISRLPHYQMMLVRPLNPAEVETLALQLNPDLSRRSLHKLTTICDGNPLFLREFCLQQAKDVTRNIPQKLKSLVTNRMRLFEAETIEILQAAAVLGREFSADRLARLMGTPMTRIENCLRLAMREVVVEPVGIQDYRFSHALLLDALLLELSPSRRARLHADIAGMMLDGEKIASANLLELATHMIHGSDFLNRSGVIDQAMRAGQESLYQLSFEQAQFFFEAVLGLTDDNAETDQLRICDACLGISESHMLQDGVGEATPMAERALALATRLNDPVRVAKSALLLSGGLPPLLDASADRIRKTLTQAKEGLGDSNLELGIRLQSRMIAYESKRDHHLLKIAEENLANARQLDNPMAISHALIANHLLLRAPGQFQERRLLSRELLQISPGVYDLDVIVHAHVQSLYDQLQTGEVNGAKAIKRRFEQLEPKQIFRNDVARIQAASLLMEGKLEAAEQAALSVKSPERGQQFITLLHLIMIRRLQGRMEEVVPLIDAVHTEMPEIPTLQAHLAMTAALAGQSSLASTKLTSLLQAEHFLPEDITRPATLIAAVEAAVATSNESAASRLLEYVEPYGENHIVQSSACYYGAANFFVGLLKLTLNQQTQAGELLEQALEQHRQIGCLPMVIRNLALLISMRHATKTRLNVWETELADLSGELGIVPEKIIS